MISEGQLFLSPSPLPGREPSMTGKGSDHGGSLSLDGHPIPLSAPDLVGPWSVNTWAAGIPSHRHKKVFHHVHLEVDLRGSHPLAADTRERLLRILGEEQVTESLGLFAFASSALSALAASGLRVVTSWSLVPGGLLPVPSRGDLRGGEAIGKALRELRQVDPGILRSAVGFHARLGGISGLVADVTLYQVHRARRHSLSLDLWGTIPRANLESLLSHLRERLPVRKAELTRYSQA